MRQLFHNLKFSADDPRDDSRCVGLELVVPIARHIWQSIPANLRRVVDVGVILYFTPDRVGMLTHNLAVPLDTNVCGQRNLRHVLAGAEGQTTKLGLDLAVGQSLAVNGLYPHIHGDCAMAVYIH